MTNTSLILPRALRIAAGVCALVLTSSCMDLTNVPNYDNESLDALVNDPTPARIANAAPIHIRQGSSVAYNVAPRARKPR